MRFDDDREDELTRLRNRRLKGEERRRAREDRAARMYLPGESDFYDEDFDGEAYSERQRPSRTGSRRGRGMKRSRKKRGRFFFGAVFFAAVLLAAFWGFTYWKERQDPYWTVAVFGLDSRDGATENALADVQLIVSMNRSDGDIKLVSVYRDTYLKIDTEGNYHKINEAYFKGGHEQGVWALEENLDLEIDDYAAFNWKAVADAINILGGIDLELSDSEYPMINSFITETVESTGIASVHLEHAGENHLDGVQAVAYCRLRLMDTDFKRTERQRKVISLALEKAKQADTATLAGLIQVILPQISTSIGVDDLLPLAKKVDQFEISDTGGFPFEKETMRISGMDCVIAATLKSNDILLHTFLYGEDTAYTPSKEVLTVSTYISELTGIYDEESVSDTSGNEGNAQAAQESTEATKEETAAPSAAQESAQTVETQSPEVYEQTQPETQEVYLESRPDETTASHTPETHGERQEETQRILEGEDGGPGVSSGQIRQEESTAPGEKAAGPGQQETAGSRSRGNTQGPHSSREEAGPGVSGQ